MSLGCALAAVLTAASPGYGGEGAAEAKPEAKKEDPFDAVKNIKLVDELTLSLGGSVRARYEKQKNYDFNDEMAGQGTFWLLRTRLV